MYECQCDDPRGLKVSVSRGRVMRICDDCHGWRYEKYANRPVITRPPQPIHARKRLSLVPLYRRSA